MALTIEVTDSMTVEAWLSWRRPEDGSTEHLHSVLDHIWTNPQWTEEQIADLLTDLTDRLYWLI